MQILNEKQTHEYIKKGLKSSSTRIWIASPWVTSDLIHERLNVQDKRMIIRISNHKDVQINDLMKFKNLIKEMGWDIKFNKNLHTKMYIFDNFAITGSSNYTNKGLGVSSNSNIETSILIDSSTEIHKLSDRFLEIWKISQPIDSYDNSIINSNKVKNHSILSRFKPSNPFNRFKLRRFF